MDSPASHHGTERPDAKNSEVSSRSLAEEQRGDEADQQREDDDDPVESLKLHVGDLGGGEVWQRMPDNRAREGPAQGMMHVMRRLAGHFASLTFACGASCVAPFLPDAGE
jgi:hypothetical protein